MDESDPGARRPRGAYAKGIARRQEILDRAIEVFAARGADRTSLRAIATEVGVTHAALTHHFGSLEQLLVEVYRESARRIGEEAADPDDLSPVEVMRRSAERNRAVPGLVQLYTALVASAIEADHPAATGFATGRFAEIRHLLAARLGRMQAEGRVRPDVDPHQTAALIIAASDGLQVQWLLDPSVDQVGALAMLDVLLSPPREDSTG